MVLLAGETVRIDIVVPPGEWMMGPEAIRRQAPGVAFVLAPPPAATTPASSDTWTWRCRRIVDRSPSRSRPLVDELSLRLASTLPFGRTRPLEIYADIYNVLGGETVTAVETGSPIGTSSGVPLVFETPIDVQRPFRVVLGGRLSF